MNSQINASFTFKRFASATNADVIKIREDRHEARTKQSTKWAVKTFEGKNI